MDSFETVRFEQKDAVRWIRMNRPKDLDAFGDDLPRLDRDSELLANFRQAEVEG